MTADQQIDTPGLQELFVFYRVCTHEETELAEAKGEAKFDPEVKNKSGKSFPHQTQDERMGRVASTTEGEAPVKTREYSPKEGTKLYSEK